MITFPDCKPGAIVECIAPTPELTLRAVYTIDRAQFSDHPHDWGVLLREVSPPRGFAGFDRSRFRVVPSSRLAVFRAMLQPIKETA